MQIVFLEEFRLLREETLHQAHGDLGGFLHDIAQLARGLHVPAALGEQGFDIQDLSADTGPGETRHHTRLLLLRDMAVPDRPHIQIVTELLRRHREDRLLLSGQGHRRTAAEGIDPLAQSAHAGLPGVVGDQGVDHLVGDLDLSRPDAHGLHRRGQQVLSCDGELFDRRISVKLNDLHPVQQRLWNRVRRVCRADEQHIRQVVGDVHVVIRKGVVLLRIQNLQQGAGRIAVVGSGELVHFVQHHDRVRSAALLDPVHDSARHRADVGPPVAADIRFVPDAAQTHTDVFAFQRFGDAAPDACLAGARRAHEQQDRTRLFPLEVHHRDLLDHTALNLLQTVVILFQDFPRLVQVDDLGFRLLPVQ